MDQAGLLLPGHQHHPRAKLIKALKHQRTFTKLFAVGDDWQSIYRFTGSDITIFTQFEDNFGASWQGRLERTVDGKRLRQCPVCVTGRIVERVNDEGRPITGRNRCKHVHPGVPGVGTPS